MTENLFTTKTGQVNGHAEIGDHVRYFDIANQNGNVQMVTEMPRDALLTTITQPNGETYDVYHTIGYTIVDTITGRIEKNCPLNAHGWTFA